MVNKLLMPQEIAVFYILPTIRSNISRQMKENGLSQKEIANILCVRESTISQYLHLKRASKIGFNDKVTSEIKESANKIKNKVDLIRETQRLLKIVIDSGAICEIHKRFSDLPEQCNIDDMGCNLVQIR